MSDFDRPRNVTKALVRREPRDGREVVVKDYGPRPWWVRVFYGRPTLRREARVYERLSGVAGIPRSFGLEGKDALVLELAPGRALGEFAPGEVPPAVFDALDRILREVHARGVAIADLHRSNILVDVGGAGGTTVHVIDFAIARIAGDAARRGWIVRQLQQLDRHAAARLRARYLGLPEPQATGTFGVLYRLGRRLK